MCTCDMGAHSGEATHGSVTNWNPQAVGAGRPGELRAEKERLYRVFRVRECGFQHGHDFSG